MKVLQVNNYHYIKGGSDRVYLETSRLLEEKGHEVIHFSVNDRQSAASRYKKYFVQPVGYFEGSYFRKAINSFRFVYSTEARRKFAALIEATRPDIAHLHITYGRLTPSILPVLAEYGVPAVMTVHEYRMLCPVSVFIDSAGRPCEECAGEDFSRCVFKRCNRGNLYYSIVSAAESYLRKKFFDYKRYITRFIMVSRFIMEKHLQYDRGLEGRVALLYNFIEPANPVPVPVRGDYYLFFGRLSAEKGVMTLLEAWRAFPELKLKMAGEGELRDRMQSYIRENGMRNVELLGHLTGSELARVVKGSSYVVVPSEWYETFGLTILEGFAACKPVIAAGIGAIPELVKDGENGFVFESGNAASLKNAIRLAEDVTAEQYRRLAGGALESTVAFGKEAHYEKLLRIYEEAIGAAAG